MFDFDFESLTLACLFLDIYYCHLLFLPVEHSLTTRSSHLLRPLTRKLHFHHQLHIHAYTPFNTMAVITRALLDTTKSLLPRDGSAIGDFFSLPMILGFVVIVFLAIGIAAMVKIYTGKGDGRTMPR